MESNEPLRTPPKTPPQGAGSHDAADPPVRDGVLPAGILQSVLDSIPDGVVVADRRGRFLLFNPAAARIVRIEGADTPPQEWSSHFGLFLPDQRTPFPPERLPLYRAMMGETVREVEIFVRNEGAPLGFWVSVSAMPLRDEAGKLRGGVTVFRDVSERKRQQEEIERAKETAETASRTKSLFLANMSHEVRNPLNAIIGMTELVLDSELSFEQREYLSVVRTSSESLLSSIDDVLEFSRIESDRVTLDPVEFDLRESLGDTVKSLAFGAHRKGLELAFRVAPDVPDLLVADPSRLAQVVTNLVGNAIKFTSRGEVVLDVETESAVEGSRVLVFSVRDTGIGIPAEKQRAIFEPFEQADASTTRRFGGTGLGLAISKKLVEALGGRIWVESAVGRGSVFRFTALFRPGPARIASRSVPDLLGVRIAVIEGNVTNRRMLDEAFRASGALPMLFERSAEFLEAVEKDPSLLADPFLLLVDAEVPDLDGFRLVETLRARGCAPATVMMLRTGNRPGDVARCRESRIDRYVMKPIKYSDLTEACLLALRAERPAAKAAGPQDTAPRRLRILVAEDSPVNQQLVTALLERDGHTVLVAENGKEALAVLLAREVDLVLMDLQMPEMDGIQATVALREREAGTGQRIPVIAMTADVMQDSRDRCLAAGMDGFVAKPLRRTELRSAIAVAAEETVPSFDAAAVLCSLGGDRNLLRTFCASFLEEAPALLLDLRKALQEPDGRALQFASHRLKGSIRYFGAETAYDLAAELEAMGRDGRLDRAGPVLARLESAVRRLTPAVRRFGDTGGEGDV